MKRADRREKNHGMNWIRQEKRLAIYLRDGMACCYCGQGIEEDDGMRLTLDHLKPYASGGSNLPSNLVTCCHICNSSRGKRSWKLFAAGVAEYINHGKTAEGIIEHIGRVRKLSLGTFLEAKAYRETAKNRKGYVGSILPRHLPSEIGAISGWFGSNSRRKRTPRCGKR